MLAEFAVPVRAIDSQRTEMLGATLGALLVSILGGTQVYFEGDSSYVCGLLDASYTPRDTFFYNCMEIVRDLLHQKHWTANWISREFNQ